MIVRTEEHNGHKVFKLHGEDIGDVVRFLESTPSKWKARGATCDKEADFYHGHEWDFRLGYRGTLALAARGWTEGAMDLSDKLDAHMPNNDHVDSWRYDVAGELPDIGRYLAGDPAHMRRHGHPKGRRPIISIFSNNWMSAAVKARQCANYGAAIVAAIDQIENRGRRVEVIGGTVAQRSGFATTLKASADIFSATWLVKRAEDPVDLAALAFSLAHPAASRRFGWAVWERSEAAADIGFGCPMGDIKEEWLTDVHPETLMLRGLQYSPSRCHDMDDALIFVRDIINEAAGEELVTTL